MYASLGWERRGLYPCMHVYTWRCGRFIVCLRSEIDDIAIGKEQVSCCQRANQVCFLSRGGEKMSPIIKAFAVGAFVCFLAFEAVRSSAPTDNNIHWRYIGIYGHYNWSKVYNVCDANTHDRQSPIDIIEEDTLLDPTLTPIFFNAFGPENDTITIVNNGHTVNFEYDKRAIRIHGGHLDGSFRVGGVHFHWGNDDKSGSEHTVKGKQFFMEMHIVAFDELRYKGVLEAADGINSIAVLGVLFEPSKEDNPVYEPLVSYLKNVTIEEHRTKIPYFPLEPLLPPNRNQYFRYKGSLTTPPCSESVMWTVFRTPQKISSRQMAEFRNLHEMVEPDGTIDFLSNNWRPPQPLHGRTVTRSFDVASSSSPLQTFFLTSPVAALVVYTLSVALSSDMI